MFRRKFLTVGAAVAGATVIGGCTDTDDPEFESGNGGSGDSGSDGGGEETSADETLVIQSHELVRENENTQSEAVSVEGTAENGSSDQLSYAEVRARFLDEDGTLLESSLDNVNDLGSGMKWQFEIRFPGYGDDARAVSDYEIAVGNTS